MHEWVKHFIEVYIEPINVSDWDEVILGWDNAAFSDFTYHDSYFEELVTVMNKAGIDFLAETKDARIKRMTDVYTQLLKECVDNRQYAMSNEIKKSDIFMQVVTDLGLTPEEQDNLLDNIAEKDFGLNVDFTCYYV